MNAANSRYNGVEIVKTTVPGPGGEPREVAYTRRRTIPDYDDRAILAEHRVADGERLDVVTAAYAGDPQRFWLLCDANTVLEPEELEVIDRVIRIPMAKG